MLTQEEKSRLPKKAQSYISVLERNLEDAEKIIATIRTKDSTRIIVDPYTYKMCVPNNDLVRFLLGNNIYEHTQDRYVDVGIKSHLNTAWRINIRGSVGILFHPESYNTGYIIVER